MTCVVIGFVRLAILQVSCRKMRSAFQEIAKTRVPQLFQIQQMAGLFLDSPFFAAARDEYVPRAIPKHFFQSRRSSAQSHTKIREKLGRKREFEFPFEPETRVRHERIVTGGRVQASKH